MRGKVGQVDQHLPSGTVTYFEVRYKFDTFEEANDFTDNNEALDKDPFSLGRYKAALRGIVKHPGDAKASTTRAQLALAGIELDSGVPNELLEQHGEYSDFTLVNFEGLLETEPLVSIPEALALTEPIRDQAIKDGIQQGKEDNEFLAEIEGMVEGGE